MRHIDWLAVDMVCQGTSLALTPDEKRMVIRRLAPRMLKSNDWHWAQATANKLTSGQVAQRLQISDRSVERIKDQLPLANSAICPVCRETMWVIAKDSIVEEHSDSRYQQCPMSKRQMLRGLAAVRPDLYRWVEEVSA